MSDKAPPYSEIYVRSWTILSIVLGLVLLSMFVFGNSFLHAGHVVWSLIRWLARPII